MNEASFKYTAYKALLEGEITREQYEFITEAGLASRIIKSLKAAGGALTKTYKDEAYKDIQEYASQQLQKIVKQIYQAGAKAGQDKSQIDPVVSMILNQALVDSKIENPAMVFRALEKNPEALEAVSEPSAASSGGEGGSAGTTITTDTLKSNPQVTAALAASVLPDKKDAIEAAVEKGKEISPDFFYEGLAKRASENTGVKEEVAHKIVMALVDAGRIKMSAKLETMLESTKTRRSGNVILERWQVLAGLRGKSLLTEVDVPDDIKKALGNDFNAEKIISNLEKDKTVSSKMIKIAKGKLKNSPDLLPQLDDLISQVNVKPGKPDANKDDTEVSNAGTEEQSSKEGSKKVSDENNSESLENKETDTYEGDLKAYEAELDAKDNSLLTPLFDNNKSLYYYLAVLRNIRDDVKKDKWEKMLASRVKNYGEDERLKKLKEFIKTKGGSDEVTSDTETSKIKPILNDIRKKVSVEDASDKDVVSVLNFIKDKVKAIELSTAA